MGETLLADARVNLERLAGRCFSRSLWAPSRVGASGDCAPGRIFTSATVMAGPSLFCSSSSQLISPDAPCMAFRAAAGASGTPGTNPLPLARFLGFSFCPDAPDAPPPCTGPHALTLLTVFISCPAAPALLHSRIPDAIVEVNFSEASLTSTAASSEYPVAAAAAAAAVAAALLPRTTFPFVDRKGES